MSGNDMYIDNDLWHVDSIPFRVRTQSIPSFSKSNDHKPARRSTSAFTSIPKPIHSNEWYLKTQELFRALRYADKSSSRLTSHHSSSSEEWYSEFQNIASEVPTRRISEASECEGISLNATQQQKVNNESESHLDRNTFLHDSMRASTKSTASAKCPCTIT